MFGTIAHAAEISEPIELLADQTSPSISLCAEYDEHEANEDDVYAEMQSIIRMETEFPIFLQTNSVYSAVPYGNSYNGNVGTSGCGISCAAMVNAYLNCNNDYTNAPTPADLATYTMRECPSGSSNMDRMKFALDTLELTYTNANIDEALKAVREGGICIFLHQPMCANVSLFTSGGHFFVVYGYNSETDTYKVADPNGANYERMGDHFARGFTRYELIRGYGGALIIEAK
jgi:hypothetical protein